MTGISRFICMLLLLLPAFAWSQPSVERQFGNARVWDARAKADANMAEAFRARHLMYPPRFIYWRAFKEEEQMELWAADSSHHQYKLVKTYKIAATCGNLGPKRVEGDFQIPEGFYHIADFNPGSNYWLSMKVSYPNKSDLILGDTKRPGGDIYIHGDTLTIGCLPMTDSLIREIYWVSLQAQNFRDTFYHIPVHIFPTRLNVQQWSYLKKEYPYAPLKLEFWSNLQAGYNYFELMHQIPEIYVDDKGKYKVLYPGDKPPKPKPNR